MPVNVTLLFSREQYLAAAEAFLRGIERRIAAGLNPQVGSVASLFISRWDVAVANKVPDHLRNQLGIAIAKRTYKATSALHGSARWLRIYNFGHTNGTSRRKNLSSRSQAEHRAKRLPMPCQASTTV